MKPLNIEAEREKLEQLLDVLEKIEQVDAWLTREEKKKEIPAGTLVEAWLFESKAEWKCRYEIQERKRGQLVERYEVLVSELNPTEKESTLERQFPGISLNVIGIADVEKTLNSIKKSG